MSQLVPTHFVQQYSANIYHLSQQKGSRLSSKVRNESQKGKTAYYDQIGSTTAVKKLSRHQPTIRVDMPHNRRMVTLVDYEWADLVDDSDKLRMLYDPTGVYTQAAMWAMGRAMDDEIIAAATGTSYTGETGSVGVVLPNSQKLAATTGSAFTDLNLDALKKAKKIFDKNEVEGKRYIACTAEQIENLLGATEVASVDFNSVQALVKGEINEFMGFEFLRIERLAATVGTTQATVASGVVGAGSETVASGARKCFAWANDGILLSKAQEANASVDKRADLSNAIQVYASMSLGSTRMEEVKVVEILCTES